MKRVIWLRLCLLVSLFVFLLAPLAAFSGAAHARPASRPLAARAAAGIANGTVIRDYADGDLYLVWDGVRYPIPSLAVLDTLGYSHSAIVNLPHADVAALAAGSPLSLRSPANPHSPVAIGSAMIQLFPPDAPPGAHVGLAGSGFGANEAVQITVGTHTTTATADASGAFRATIIVPAGAKVGSILQVYAYGTSSKTLEVEPLKVTQGHARQPAAIALTPASAHPGDKVSISGANFAAGEQVTIQINGATVLTEHANASGAFAATYAVPASTPAGTYTVQAAGASGDKASATLTVAAPRFTAPANGTVIRDRSDGNLYLVWDGTRYPIPSLAVLDTLGYSHSAIVNLQHANVAALATGSPLSLRSPANPASPVAIGSAMLTVIPPAAAPGAPVALSGTGFGPNELVQITVASTSTAAPTDGSGAFHTTITVPAGAKVGSTLQVYAYGASSKTLEVEPLKVTGPRASQPPAITLSPTSVHPGDKVSVSGANFAAGEQVALQINGVTLLTVHADAAGAFTASYSVPAGTPAGAYTVQAVGASGDKASATVTVTAPRFAAPANGTVIRDRSDGNLYLVWDGVRYPIPSLAVLDTLGYSHSAIVNLPHADVAALAAGPPLSLRSPANPHSPVAIGSAMIQLFPPDAAPGAHVGLAGSGFGPHEAVQITVGAYTTTATADASGAFRATIIVPVGAAAGSILQVYAYGTSSKILEVEPLKVTVARAQPAAITLTPTTAHPGDTISVSGAGFAPSDLVQIKIGSTLLLNVRADAGGSFSNVNYTLPATTAPGTYTVTASSTLTARSASATLTVQPISRPGATLSNGTLIRDTGTGRIYLIWEGVRHWIEGMDVFHALGYNGGAIQNYLDSFVASIPEGAGLTIRQIHGLADPFSPIASGDAVVSLNPPAAAAGATITLSGTGYAPNETVQITFNGGTTTVATNGQGAFSATVAIPSSAGTGTILRVYAYGTTSKVLEVEPIVVISAVPAPQISVQPTSVAQGGSVQVSGTGFAGGEQVQIFVAGTAGVTTVTANGGGAFSNVSVSVPAFVTPGQQALVAYGTSSRLVANATVTVTQPAPTPATITVKPTTANPGGLVLISGQGFAAGEPVNISFAGKQVLVVTADSSGNFSNIGFTVPVSATAGTYAVTAVGTRSGHAGVAGLTVVAFTPSLSVSPNSSTPGGQVTVTGQGFAPNETVTLALNGQALATSPSTIKTSASGTFSATITVPTSALAGANTLAATGATSRGTATATLSVNLPVQSTWYLAGGSTQPGYDTQIELVNANDQPASVTFSFMFTSGTPVPYSTTVPANSRATVDEGSIVGAGRDVFAMITADRKIGAEQTIFRNGQDFSQAIGVSAPQKTWYLAEGYTGLTFREYIRIFNPGSATASIDLRLLPFNGRPPTAMPETVNPRSGLIVDVNSIVPNQSLSAIVNSDQPVVVDRLITFGPGGYGATEQMGSNTASNTWLFAEGSTANNFETYLTILNPNSSQQAIVTATFFDQLGNVLGNDTVVVDPLHRGNIKVNNFVHSSGIATIVTSNQPIFVERPLYFGPPNGAAAGGSDVFGRNGGGVSWLFPAGNTGGSFREFLLLENPSLQTATVRVRFYGTNGQTTDYTVNVPAKSRATVDVLRDVHSLPPGEHGSLVTSTNGVPIIAEQSIYSDNFSKGDGTAGIAQ